MGAIDDGILMGPWGPSSDRRANRAWYSSTWTKLPRRRVVQWSLTSSVSVHVQLVST